MIRRRALVSRFTLALAVCGCASLARAQLPVFEQPMAANGGILRNSQLWIDPTGQNDSDNDAIAWDDFQFGADTTVTRIRWWGEVAPPLGFEISFYHQDPNTTALQPDMFAAGSGPITHFVTTTATSISAGGALYRFEAVLPTPLVCAANTRYFVSVVGRSPYSYAAWNWASSSVSTNGTFWWSRGMHMYFHLPDNRALALATADGWPLGATFCAGDGTATPCPCGSNGASGHGCPSSLSASGAWLTASGTASLAADSVKLWGAGLPSGPGLYFQGTTQLAGGAGSLFGDGLRCVGGTVIRLGVVSAAASTSTYPSVAPNDAPVHARGLVAPGTYHYQLWYRDADANYCTSSTFNLTNGVSVTWTN